MDIRAFTDRLSHYRDRVHPLMLASLPAREPRKYLYDLIARHLTHSGKSLRPAMCIATCEALGGNADQATPIGAALEMLHNAFLIHDDIEDGSEYRRGQRTMYVEHGVPLAINVGDAMQALSLQMVRRSVEQLQHPVARRVLEEFDHMLAESLEGQAMEIGWVRDNQTGLTEDDYLLMILKKTCWYSFIHPFRIGALLARPSDAGLDRFNRFGMLVGTAFQIQDDVLNIVGERSRYGKEIGGDLWEGKRTLMLLHALRRLPAREVERLTGILAKPRSARMSRDIAWITAQLQRAGSVEYARDAARAFATAAAAEFDSVFGDARPSPHKDFLRAVVEFAIARSV